MHMRNASTVKTTTKTKGRIICFCHLFNHNWWAWKRCSWFSLYWTAQWRGYRPNNDHNNLFSLIKKTLGYIKKIKKNSNFWFLIKDWISVMSWLLFIHIFTKRRTKFQVNLSLFWLQSIQFIWIGTFSTFFGERCNLLLLAILTQLFQWKVYICNCVAALKKATAIHLINICVIKWKAQAIKHYLIQ